MANTVVVTKKSVTRTGSFFMITLRVVVNDGAEDVLDMNLSAKYNPASGSYDNAIDEIKNEFKKRWAEYLNNKAIFDSAVLDSTISDLQTQANLFVNQ